MKISNKFSFKNIIGGQVFEDYKGVKKFFAIMGFLQLILWVMTLVLSDAVFFEATFEALIIGLPFWALIGFIVSINAFNFNLKSGVILQLIIIGLWVLSRAGLGEFYPKSTQIKGVSSYKVQTGSIKCDKLVFTKLTSGEEIKICVEDSSGCGNTKSVFENGVPANEYRVEYSYRGDRLASKRFIRIQK